MGDNREDNPHEISFLENRKVDYETSFKHYYFSKQSSLPDGRVTYLKMWKEIIKAHPSLRKRIIFEDFLLQL